MVEGVQEITELHVKCHIKTGRRTVHQLTKKIHSFLEEIDFKLVVNVFY